MREWRLPQPALPRVPHYTRTAGATSLQSQTMSVQLAAGDHPIVVEWMQVSGTAKVRTGGL